MCGGDVLTVLVVYGRVERVLLELRSGAEIGRDKGEYVAVVVGLVVILLVPFFLDVRVVLLLLLLLLLLRVSALALCGGSAGGGATAGAWTTGHGSTRGGPAGSGSAGGWVHFVASGAEATAGCGGLNRMRGAECGVEMEGGSSGWR